MSGGRPRQRVRPDVTETTRPLVCDTQRNALCDELVERFPPHQTVERGARRTRAPGRVLRRTSRADRRKAEIGALEKIARNARQWGIDLPMRHHSRPMSSDLPPIRAGITHATTQT